MSLYYFSDADIEEIKNSVTIPEIFDYLGIRHKRKGNYVLFICPKHSATHFGAANYSLSKGICRCFACNTSFSVFKLVQIVQNKDFHSAVAEVAEYAGIADRYLKQNKPHIKTKYPLRPLKSSEKKLLGFSPINSYDEIINIVPYKLDETSLKPGQRCIPSEYDYYYITRKSSYSLNDYMKEEPLAYRIMILERVAYMLGRIDRALMGPQCNDTELIKLEMMTITSLKEKREEILNIGNEFGLQRVLNAIKTLKKE